jgi:hypothetical protein
VDTVLAKPVTPTVLRQALATLFRGSKGKVSRLPDRHVAGRRGSPADQAG